MYRRGPPCLQSRVSHHLRSTQGGPPMSDPNPAAADPQARSLFRSFVLDPALVFARVIDCGDIARALAEEVGKTRDRIFTPLVTLSLFLSQLLSDDHTCPPAVARLLAWRTARGLPPCS